MNERWRDVPGFPGYRVSDRGLVRGRRGWILRPTETGKGHLLVGLYDNPETPSFQLVSRIVLMAFVGAPPFKGACALHYNDIPDDNRLDNLRWGTRKENHADAIRNGTNWNKPRAGTEKLIPRIQALKAKGLSNREVGRRLCISHTTVARYREGGHRP